MDVATYRRLGIGTPFEEKPRSARDSGMENINGGLSRRDVWKRTFALEKAALEKYPPPEPPLDVGSFVEFRQWRSERVYKGTVRDWLLWIPPGSERTKLVVFNDGGMFLQPPTSAAAQLAALGENVGRTAAVFVNPGVRPGYAVTDRHGVADDAQRSLEYDSVAEDYGRFLLEEILPIVSAHVRVSEEPEDRLLVGMSSGAVGAFCAAWFFPESFGKVCGICGSFVNVRGAHNVPWLIRNTRRKPIRVLTMTGSGDMENSHGSWPLASFELAAALEFAGYESRFVYGTGGHGLVHFAHLMGKAMRWLLAGEAVEFPEERRAIGGRL